MEQKEIFTELKLEICRPQWNFIAAKSAARSHADQTNGPQSGHSSKRLARD